MATPTKGFKSVGGHCGGEPDETISILACLEALSIVIMAYDIDAPTYIEAHNLLLMNEPSHELPVVQ